MSVKPYCFYNKNSLRILIFLYKNLIAFLTVIQIVIQINEKYIPDLVSCIFKWIEINTKSYFLRSLKIDRRLY